MPRDQDIHASLRLRQLRGAQGRELLPFLRREPLRQALRIGVAASDVLPAMPGVAWTRLWLVRDALAGDLRAHADQALPLSEESFDLVWLQHALETATQPDVLLAEACRVLAPGGLLVVSGVHPLSPWAAWFRWRARGQRQHLHWPWQLVLRLRQAGLTMETLRRQGEFWPRAQQRLDHRHGGGYLLALRKPRRQLVPLKLRPLPVGVPVGARLSPGARRLAETRREVLCDD